MSRSSSRLLATTRTRLPSSTYTYQSIRSFSQTCPRQADSDRPNSLLDGLRRNSTANQSTAPPKPESSMHDLKMLLAQDAFARARNQPTASERILGDEENSDREDWGPANEPFHFHIYAHKHNSHITVTKPNRNAIISMSTGQIGFKKSKRGTYDAAYQLTAYVIDKLHQGNWHKNITSMEVALRGFGAGREAATKVLLGNEGRMLRDKIVKVSDATRLKFGGTRSPKPRRLG
ncbi:translational machinery component [Hypoxylon fuscum]|nr:translational machinery component [Hypoxylon fuscum]